VITGFDGPPKRFATSHPTDKMKIVKDEKAAKAAVLAESFFTLLMKAHSPKYK
jgi:hypothetical protein